MTAIEQLKRDYPINRIADHLGIEYTTRGSKSTGNCPFCDDRSGHLYLYPESNRYHCFKCLRSGDQIDLYCEIKGIQPKEAIGELSGTKATQYSNQERYAHNEAVFKPESKPNDKDYTELYMAVLNYLELSPKGLSYLESRAITEKMAIMYDLRSIDDPATTAKGLRANLINLGFCADELIKSGLYDISSKGQEYFCFFLPAILFPHISQDGKRITGMSSRNLSGTAKSFKLHNRKQSPAFGTGIIESSEILVFEGIINALSYEILTDLDNWIALSGLITPTRYRELKNLCPDKDLVLALDPDEAGQRALDSIAKCRYVDWAAFAQMMGYRTLQKHPDGKGWDINDYLINRGKI